MRLHKGFQLADRRLQFVDNRRYEIYQTDFFSFIDGLAGEQGDGGIDCLLLAAKIQDITPGFAVIEHSVGARESLSQAVVFEVFIDIQGIEVFRIEVGQQHGDHDDKIYVKHPGL